MLYDCQPSDTRQFFLHRRDLNHGGAYVGFNKLTICDKEESERLLTTDCGRGPFLGATNFVPHRLPRDEQGRKLFLLEMDGGPGTDHEAFRRAVVSLLQSPDCLARASPDDYVMRTIIRCLEEDVKDCKDKQEIVIKALPPFFLRALHWAVLELELTKAEYNTLYEVYYANKPTGPTCVISRLWGTHNMFSDSSLQKLDAKVEQIYRRSSVLASWNDKRPEFHQLSLTGIIRILQTAFSIAGLQGPYFTVSALLLNQTKHIPEDFVMPTNDREKIRL
eukprot:gene31878-38543_t